MLTKSYTNRYIIVLICFCFSLWIQENRAAAKAVMYTGIGSSEGKEALSQEEQKKLLERLLKTKGLPKGVKASEVIGIIGEKELEKVEVVKEISPLEKQLTDIERRLNSSLFVSQNDLKKIGSELYGPVQKELGELSQQEEETVSLRNRAIDLAEQLRMFEGLMRVESAVHMSINEKRIDNDVIANVERELKNIKDRAKFQNSSSFSKRKADLEQLINQQKNLLAMAPEQRVQEEVAKMERYLTVLENALKKDVINPEIIKYIRISIDEMAAPQKLNFPAPQQSIITKRIDNLKHLLGIFDSLLHMQQVVIEQKDLSPIMTEGIAEELRNVQKELEQLSLAKDLSDSTNKHIARVNNQLVPKLSVFLDQLARSAEVISTLAQFKEVENQFKLLQKLRNNLDLTKDQEGDIDKKFAEVESLLNQQRDSLLEQQRKHARQIELEKERLQKQEQLYRELESREEEKRKAKEQKERQAFELRQKRVKQEQKMNALHKEIKKLEAKLNKLTADWIKAQNEEVTSSELYQRLKKLYSDLNLEKHERKLKILREQLEEGKKFIGLFFYDVNRIHEDMLRLRKLEDVDKEVLMPLLTEWMKQLLRLKDILLKEQDDLKQMNEQKKETDFVRRNKFVMMDISTVIKRIDTMYKDDNALLLLIGREITKEKMNRDLQSERQEEEAFSQYF